MKWISFFSVTIGFSVFTALSLSHAALEKVPAKTLSKEDQKLYIELTGKDYAKMSEAALYSELLASYQSQNEIQFHAQLETFLKKYKKSVYGDNAIYLAGKMALEKKNYSKAVYYFDRVAKSYPSSNKVVASHFAKGTAYRRMNLNNLAVKVFDRIKKQYPGSPESYRADTEMKLIQAN